MANPSTDTSTSDSGSASAKPPTDSFATNETVTYISDLLSRRNKSQSQLSQTNSDLLSAQERLKRISSQYQEATTQASQADLNMKAAANAGKNMLKVANYFRKQETETAKMAENARLMALNTFQAMQYLGREGLARLEEIQNAVSSSNAKPDNTDRQWTQFFTGKVQDTYARGTAALGDLYTAADASFKALIQSQTISQRAQQYRKRFEILYAEIGKVTHRLMRELALAKKAADKLQRQQIVLQNQVAILQSSVEQLQLEHDLLDAEYTAAQQGAAYAYQGA